MLATLPTMLMADRKICPIGRQHLKSVTNICGHQHELSSTSVASVNVAIAFFENELKFLNYIKSPGGNLPPSQKAFSYNYGAGMMTYFGQDRWHG